MSRNRGPRVVLGIGIAAGLIHLVVFPLANPAQVGIATDVYYHAAQTMLDGGDFYAVTPPSHPGFSFSYPPLVTLVFVPHALVGSAFGAFVLQSVINLATVTALTVLVVRFLDRHAPIFERIDRVLVAGYAVVSVPMVSNLVMGQVNIQLACAVAVAAIALERGYDRLSGVAFGVAAAVKLFPTLFGTWLLRRPAWHAIGAAIITGLTTILVGLLVFGVDAYDLFVSTVVGTEMQAATFPDGPDPHASYLTIRRQLALLPIPGDWLFPLGVALLTPVVAAVNWTQETVAHRLLGLFGVVLATLILFPLEPFYLVIAVFPLLATVYLLPPGQSRTLLLTGVVFLSIPLTYDSLLPALNASLLPPLIRESIRAIAKPVFGVILPPMIGVWMVFIAAIRYQAQTVAGATLLTTDDGR